MEISARLLENANFVRLPNVMTAYTYRTRYSWGIEKMSASTPREGEHSKRPKAPGVDKLGEDDTHSAAADTESRGQGVGQDCTQDGAPAAEELPHGGYSSRAPDTMHSVREAR